MTRRCCTCMFHKDELEKLVTEARGKGVTWRLTARSATHRRAMRCRCPSFRTALSRARPQTIEQTWPRTCTFLFETSAADHLQQAGRSPAANWSTRWRCRSDHEPVSAGDARAGR